MLTGQETRVVLIFVSTVLLHAATVSCYQPLYQGVRLALCRLKKCNLILDIPIAMQIQKHAYRAIDKSKNTFVKQIGYSLY